MNFINKNIAIILSLGLAYTFIHSTAEYWPEIIDSLFGVSLEEAAITKYKFPVVILAFVIFPVIRGLKNKLKP